MADISKAQSARRDIILNKLTRYSAYGILTARQFVERTLADGCILEAVDVADDAAQAKLQREYDILNRGFNVPWGNECHPTTIRAAEMKRKLKAGLRKTEFRLHRPDREYFSTLNKTVYDYALQVKEVKR